MGDLPSDVASRERDLYRALLELACCDEIDPFLNEALALVVTLTGAERGYIELVEDRDEGGPPRFSMAHGCYDPEVEAIRDAFSRGIIADAIADGRTIALESALRDPRAQKYESVQRNLTGAVLCAPLGTPPFGVIYLQDRKAPGPFTEEHRKVVEDVARYLTKFAHRLLEGQRRLDEVDHTASLRAKIRADGIIGRSKAIARVLREASFMAPNDGSVLITGPSGTGKTQLARVIHDNSLRAKAKFVEQNCAALTDSLFESEMFGHVKGSFTGATENRRGRVAEAEDGTLFLDEIADLSAPLQAKLLQLLQDRIYFRVGDSEPQRANVRIIAATNVDLKKRVAERQFRDDLFHRLDVLRIRMPSLEERPEDIAALAEHFCETVAAKSAPHLRLSPSAMRALEASEWSGNVRALYNCVFRAVVAAAGEQARVIERHHVFPDDEGAESRPATLEEERRRSDRQIVERALDAADWNRTQAAERLGISRSHIYNLIESLGIKRKRR
ncbi:Hypothetical protein A7982_10289 [Minicystis rosea]|nr:Hypothetical protein A7982_10289 [Minicystis rosea]